MYHHENIKIHSLGQWFSTFFGSRHTIIHHTFSRHTRAHLTTTTTLATLPKTLFSIFNIISRGTPWQSRGTLVCRDTSVENHWPRPTPMNIKLHRIIYVTHLLLRAYLHHYIHKFIIYYNRILRASSMKTICSSILRQEPSAIRPYHSL